MNDTATFVSFNGGQLHFESAGVGPAVLLIHAGIADMRMWQPQLEAFSRQYRVARVDVRGFGQSSVPNGDYAAHEDIRAVLDAAKVESAAIVGVSMGGTIAIDFVLAHPERARALVAVATGPNGYDRWGDEIRKGWAAEEAALAAGDMERAIEINLQM